MTQDRGNTPGGDAPHGPGGPHELDGARNGASGKGPRLRGWPKWLLFASLAVNLLVAGLILGAAWSLRGGHGPHARDLAAPYTAALAPQERRALFRAFRREHRAAAAQAEGGLAPRAAYAEALELLRREPFDAAAFESVVDAQFRTAEAAQAAGRRVLLEHITALSPEARAAYADRLEEALARRAKRRPGRPPEG